MGHPSEPREFRRIRSGKVVLPTHEHSVRQLEWNKRIGVHLGTAGGASNAVEKAREIGANTFQIFSSSPRMWRRAEGGSEAGRADAGAAARSTMWARW